MIDMKIEKVIVGPLRTNCYVLDIKGTVLVIDPGAEYKKIMKVIQDREIVGIIITHHHFDHTGALRKFDKSIPVYDINNLRSGENIIEKFKFDVTPFPGHKEDLIGIYFKNENALFAGDFVFRGMIGRWDLKGGNVNDMKKSIKKILEFPSDLKIYPGHGGMTTLLAEEDNLRAYL